MSKNETEYPRMNQVKIVGDLLNGLLKKTFFKCFVP